jgi:hypothetical protein
VSRKPESAREPRAWETLVEAFLAVLSKPANTHSIPIEELPASVDDIKAAIRESIRARFREQDLTEEARTFLREPYLRLGFVATKEERWIIEEFLAAQAVFDKEFKEFTAAHRSGAPLPSFPSERRVSRVRLRQFVRMAEAEAEIDRFLSEFPLQHVIAAPPSRHWWSGVGSFLRGKFRAARRSG